MNSVGVYLRPAASVLLLPATLSVEAASSGTIRSVSLFLGTILIAEFHFGVIGVRTDDPRMRMRSLCMPAASS
jgi:hypothetical protein